jgi:hypothetical protein
MCKQRPERIICKYCKYSTDPNLNDSGCHYPDPVGEKVPIDMEKYKRWRRTAGKRTPYKEIDLDWIPIEKAD